MVVSALVALALAGAPGATEACRGAAATPPATAYLGGDTGPVATVSAALKRRGVVMGPPGCPGLRVSVTEHEGRMRVARLDPAAGAAARDVTTPDTAAALIESWLRTDIAAPLLVALAEPPAADAAETAAPPESEAATTVVAAPPAAAGPRLAPTLALVGEAGLDRAGSHGFGLGGAACVNLGPVCAGLAARLARTSVIGNGDVMREADGAYAADAMLAADVPWHLGRATLRPGAAVGAGWVGARGAMLERHDGVLDVVGVRAEARLAMDVRVGGGVALEIEAAGGAGGSSSVQETMTMAGGMSMPGGTSGTRERVTLDHKLVPMVHAGLGVRFGGAAP